MIHYLSYDRYPAHKGAAVHIHAFVTALAARYDRVHLTTIENSESDATQTADLDAGPDAAGVWRDLGGGIRHRGLRLSGRNLIERAGSFRRQMWHDWPTAQVLHFRSIFEGYPLVTHYAGQKSDPSAGWINSQRPRIIYEVNGLPSIELKYHYPPVADDRELLRKLRHQEDTCLRAADLVITVSQVNAEHLLARGVAEHKLRVIPNGVHVDRFEYQRPRQPSDNTELLYVGTLAAWQGLRVAIEALSLYRREHPATLRIVGDGRARQRRELWRWAEKCNVADAIEVLPPQPQAELAQYYQAADCVLAPLLANDRNRVQGCCPLKVLEAMASGTPLIASDLAVVRCLVRDGQEGLLVRPGSAKAIKDGLLRLRNCHGLGVSLSAAARRRVKQHFTWQHAQQRLLDAYAELLDQRPKI